MVRAVRERRLVVMQGSEFSRPSPRAPEAIRRLAAAFDSLRVAAVRSADACRADRAPRCWARSPYSPSVSCSARSTRARPAVLRAIDDPASTEGTILFSIRLPRVLLAFVVGAGLALTGTALQALVRNPLADPYLLGTVGRRRASGPCSRSRSPPPASGRCRSRRGPVPSFRVALVYRLALVAGTRLDPRILLLAGVVVSAFTGAVMAAVLTLVPAPELRNAFLWLLGGFGAVELAVARGLRRLRDRARACCSSSERANLDLLSLGEEPAQYLGADVERVKRVVYFSASLLTAAAVAVSGVVGFVGLVVPHAMRRAGGAAAPLAHSRGLPDRRQFSRAGRRRGAHDRESGRASGRRGDRGDRRPALRAAAPADASDDPRDAWPHGALSRRDASGARPGLPRRGRR